MSNRVCIRCGQVMQPIKNGFYYSMPDGKVRNSDLWGCLTCRRFQIHGSPKTPILIRNIVKSGNFVVDPGGDNYLAILDPEIDFTEEFDKHMIKWYPEWNWKEKSNER